MILINAKLCMLVVRKYQGYGLLVILINAKLIKPNISPNNDTDSW